MKPFLVEEDNNNGTDWMKVMEFFLVLRGWCFEWVPIEIQAQTAPSRYSCRSTRWVTFYPHHNKHHYRWCHQRYHQIAAIHFRHPQRVPQAPTTIRTGSCKHQWRQRRWKASQDSPRNGKARMTQWRICPPWLCTGKKYETTTHR